MTPEPRPLLDASSLHRILFVVVLTMVLIGVIEAVETARQAKMAAPVQKIDTQDSPDGPAVTEPAERVLIEKAALFIEPFEGRRHRVYGDSTGHLTIGVGFNLDRFGAEGDINHLLPGVSYQALRRGELSLTDAQIEVLLQHDTRVALNTARHQVAGFDSLPDDAKLVIIDMTFNMGSLNQWHQFKAALSDSDFTAAADAMQDSRWRRQTGRRAAAHIDLMLSLAQG